MQELALGEQARAQGFEGRARVCARRAAGIAVRAYLEDCGLSMPSSNSIHLLEHLSELPQVSAGARQAAGFLLTRVNQSYELPVEVDLLQIVRQLVTELEAGPVK